MRDCKRPSFGWAGDLRLLAVVLAAGMAANASAVTITDGFDDGNRTNSPDGINWYAIEGFTTDGLTQKPVLTVEDDSANLGAGNALFVEAISSNSEVMGVFDSPVSIGPGIGSKVVLSFDMRVNGSTAGGDFRLGLYNANEAIGTGGFGTSDGDYDEVDPGVVNDIGTYVEIDNDLNFGSGNGARLREEKNVNAIMGGSGDTDYVAAPPSGTFSAIDGSGGTNSIVFTLERIGPGSDPADFLYTIALTTPTFSGSFSGSDGNDSVPGTTTDTFDYFIAATTSDTDWVIDNFSLDVVNVPEPATLWLAGLCAVALCGRRP